MLLNSNIYCMLKIGSKFRRHFHIPKCLCEGSKKNQPMRNPTGIGNYIPYIIILSFDHLDFIPGSQWYLKMNFMKSPLSEATYQVLILFHNT